MRSCFLFLACLLALGSAEQLAQQKRRFVRRSEQPNDATASKPKKTIAITVHEFNSPSDSKQVLLETLRVRDKESILDSITAELFPSDSDINAKARKVPLNVGNYLNTQVGMQLCTFV